MQTSEQPTTITYKSGTHPTQGWDVMQVIYSQGGRIINSFVIARDTACTIVRKIDSFPEQWVIIENAEDLRGFEKCFADRDKLAAERCGCGHSLSLHTRDVRQTDARTADSVSGVAASESGCSECACPQWKRVSH
jgi:hypothetical protein